MDGSSSNKIAMLKNYNSNDSNNDLFVSSNATQNGRYLKPDVNDPTPYNNWIIK